MYGRELRSRVLRHMQLSWAPTPALCPAFRWFNRFRETEIQSKDP
jgi:hypothetical protein